jgi:UDP-N-acetylglucosamine 2-epimerase (non-hydrolysing)
VSPFRAQHGAGAGHTTTAFASALAAYYCKIAVGQIEAGLQSHDLYNPFPEEANRRLASVLAELHFAPTALSRDNLLAEGVAAEKMVVTGNTVIDTLRALSVLPHSWENAPLAGHPGRQFPPGAGHIPPSGILGCGPGTYVHGA